MDTPLIIAIERYITLNDDQKGMFNDAFNDCYYANINSHAIKRPKP